MNIFFRKLSHLRRLFIFFILLLSLFTIGKAQDNREIANQLIQIADEIYANTSAYIQARDAYVQVLDFDPDNLKANYMTGFLYLQTINKERATSYLLKVHEIDPEYTFDLLYLIGRGYQYGLNFNNAIEFFNRYKEYFNSEPDYIGDDKIPLRIVDQRIKECEIGQELVSSPLNYNITNVGGNINSQWPDYGPSVNRDETIMVFTSRRQEGNVNPDVFDDNFPYEDIFISEKEDDSWMPAQNISPRINTAYFESSLFISNDGRELYLYLDDNQGDIYISRKQNDGKWSVSQSMPGDVNTSAKETSLSISQDGNLMFFASNRSGTLGGLDIYYSKKDRQGNWTEIVNIGPQINTPGNDDFPFLDEDGKTLYFSSEGHEGMGGYDVYKTVYDSSESRWIKPVNMGYPINTPDNDISFITTLGGTKGYFSSVREDGFGYQDIYIFTIPEEIQNITEDDPEIRRVEEEVVRTPIRVILHVRDQAGDPIDAQVQMRNTSGGYLLEVNKENTGKFIASVKSEESGAYTISAEKDAYTFYNENITLPAMNEDEQVFEYNLVLKKLEQGTSSVLRNVYFDFNKATLKDESAVEINKLYRMLSENSRLLVEIGGHTDNIGTKQYNYKLSYLRAKAVVDALIKQGIDPVRLKAVGYGEDKPLASNDDEKDGRELNRRVDFKVLRYIR